jgi:hypothetical protein
MNYTYPLIAINIDGSTILLYTREEVLNFIDKYGIWNDHHRVWASWWDWQAGIHHGEYHYYPWIVRDDRGKKVNHRDFYDAPSWKRYNEYQAKIRFFADKGLPIPRTGKRKWRRHHAPAMKNSGSGHRNRNRAKAIDDAKEYGIKNDVGNRVIPWEGH